MTDPAIIEAAARAMGDILNDFEDDPKLYRMLARAALAAVTPLIEAAALERAAKVAEECPAANHPFGERVALVDLNVPWSAAAAIRALIGGGGVLIPPHTTLK